MMNVYLSNTLRLGSILALVFIMFSCIEFIQPEFKGVKNVQVGKFGATGIDVEITANIYNPNNYNLTVMGSDLDFYIGNRKMGKANIKKKVKIIKNTEADYTFHISIGANDIKNSLGSFMNILMTGRANVKVSGTIRGRAKLITKSFPIEFSHVLNLNNQ